MADRIGWPLGLRVLVALACATAAGCSAKPVQVANPEYEAWAAFGPGSYATMDGLMTTGGRQEAVRITRKLIYRDGGQAVVERAVTVLDGQGERQPSVTRCVQAARIDPADDPRTHPGCKAVDLGREQVNVAGRDIPCQVRQLALCGRCSEFVPASGNLSAREAVSPEIPGGIAWIHIEAKAEDRSFEMTARVVDYKALAGGKESW